MLFSLLALALPTAALAATTPVDCPPSHGTLTCTLFTSSESGATSLISFGFPISLDGISASVSGPDASVDITTGDLTGNCAGPHGGTCHFSSGTVFASANPGGFGPPGTIDDSLSGGTVTVGPREPLGHGTLVIPLRIDGTIPSGPGVAGGRADISGAGSFGLPPNVPPGFAVSLGSAEITFTNPLAPVRNPSFQDLGGPLDQSCGHSCSFRFGSIPGWTLSDPSDSGQFHPSIGPHGFFDTFAPHDGDISAFSNGGTISQKVGVIAPDLIYTLSLEIGRRTDAGFAGSADLLLPDLGLKFMAHGVTPLPGHWSTFTARFASTGLPTGDPIIVQLNSSGFQANFDSVKVTTSPIPEPGTLSLLGTGLIGLAGLARRKLKI